MISRRGAGRTERIYETDGACMRFSATVLECREIKGKTAVLLDRTAFFPEGGGQAADRGMLHAIPVTDVQNVEGEPWHFVEAPIRPGTVVEGILDQPLRWVRMQNHTGEHIVSGLIHRRYGYDNVGFHLGDGVVTMDYNGVLSREQLDEIEDAANEEIWRNLAVQISFPDAGELSSMDYRSKLELTENVRIVTVEDVDVCACCAPHVTRTGEIGVIRLTDVMHYKGGVRVWMLCGAWAMKNYRRCSQDLLAISQMFSVGPEQARGAVEKIHRELLTARADLGEARQKWIAERLASMTHVDGHRLLFEDALDAVSQRMLADGGADRSEGICGVFCPAESGYRYVLVSRKLPLRELARAFHTVCHGRGGGTDRMLQGTVSSDRGQIEAFFDEVPVHEK